jgi:hypothetical protein
MSRFETEFLGPPRRKMYIWRDEEIPADAPPNTVRGWGFAVSFYDDSGAEQPLFDSWEETLEEILRYPPLYGPSDLVWRRANTGEEVDLRKLAF